MMYALLAFAAAFLIVGLARVVEFKAAGINPFRRKVLIPIHVLGVFVFTGAIVILAIDASEKYKMIDREFFLAGVLLLFPVHIYVAVKRRILLRDQTRN